MTVSNIAEEEAKTRGPGSIFGRHLERPCQKENEACERY
jgi:hypothetical protein